MVEIKAVKVDPGAGNQMMIGQAGFIKTAEDLYEALVGVSPEIKFGLAFSEASGPCLVRSEGNYTELQKAAEKISLDIASGHSFVIIFRNAFPINVNNAIQNVPEVISIFCSTANPVQVIVAETEQGSGIIGVVDGSSPKGVEGAQDRSKRRKFLRDLGYKM